MNPPSADDEAARQRPIAEAPPAAGGQPVTPAPPDLPASIAGYRIERVLGGGAMSTVYLAHHPSLPQWTALKVLPAELAENPALRARFVHEGDTTARLGHPNIVAVYGRGVTEDGQLWIAMQYISGTDAEAALRSGAMPPARALRIVDEVAKVLDDAHRRGVVHQDVKPSNILLGERGGEERVVLSDFGAALTAQSGDPADSPMVASLAYAAPEVITGGPVDGRADVYSLGCTLFRLLTGRYPFRVDGSMADTITAHLRQTPPRPSEFLPWADSRLDGVISTALAKDPAHRYATAGQLAAAAHAAVATPIQARPRPVTATRPLIIAAGIAAIVTVIAAVVWLVLPASAPDPAVPSPAVTTAQAAPAREDLARLTSLLPAGYSPGTCRPAPVADPGVAAVLSCGPNSDPGGPASATYALARTPEDLRAALQRVITSARPVICSGNIQSPGPWRHLATPAVTQGTVFCGIGDGRPLVAWTNDPQLLLATTQSQDANQLYTWWAAHS
ncbi:Protein kinase [uncultured Mycobacterium sp.]|uniref:non-specific serine/threonine protein kinase n=1 Tax=uncultured Mycobacterium sp. TaxID=171292 RepID=A0A1Y5PNT4_9MYCO|nr:Protein kinase [uncultured Mycobacterium sp.]